MHTYELALMVFQRHPISPTPNHIALLAHCFFTTALGSATENVNRRSILIMTLNILPISDVIHLPMHKNAWSRSIETTAYLIK